MALRAIRCALAIHRAVAAALLFGLLRECLEKGVVSEQMLREGMARNHVRHDALELVERTAPLRRLSRAAATTPRRRRASSSASPACASSAASGSGSTATRAAARRSRIRTAH